MPSHRLLLRAGYVRQLGAGHLLAPAARLPGEQARRAGHPRGDGPRSARRRWRCRSSIRPTCGGRAGATRRSARSWSGSRTAADRDMVLAMTHEEVVAILLRDIVQQLPPAADDGLPLPDEVPRRAALARRPHPRPRVRHEGRVQLRPRRGRPRPELRAPVRGVRPDLRAPRPRHGRGRRRRRDHGRQRRPRVHVPQRVRRGHPRPVRRLRLRGEPADRGRRQARACRPEAPKPMEEVATPGRDHDRDPGALPRRRSRARPPRPPSS